MAALRFARLVTDPSGYAATTALLTVAALSIVAAAGLNLSQTQDRRAKQLFKDATRDEALNEALMRFAGRLQTSTGGEAVEDTITVEKQTITLRAEHEALKWPLAKAGDLTTTAFNHKARGISLDEAHDQIARSEGRLGQGRLGLNPNDCLRRLFSPFGQATTDDVVLEPQVAAFTGSTSKEGQVWRLRAVMGSHVRELYVRFIGRPDQLYAVIAEDNFNAKEVPVCAN
jgi:hypothetical protein